MEIRKQFEKETGKNWWSARHDDCRYTDKYVEWLESKLKQSNIRTMDNPDQESGERPERPDDDDKG